MAQKTVLLFVRALIIGVILHLSIDYLATPDSYQVSQQPSHTIQVSTPAFSH